MKPFAFTIDLVVGAKNMESAKNKLVNWLEPSLALKKNDSIRLKNVAPKSLGGSKKVEEAPKSEEVTDDEDWDPSWSEGDWDSLDEGDDSDDSDDSDDLDFNEEDFDDDDIDWEEVEESDESETPPDEEDDGDFFNLSALKKKSETEDDDDDDGDEDFEW